MGIPPTQTRPTVRIEAVPGNADDHQCGSSECRLDADLKLIFVGQPTAPEYRCMEHWSGARSVLSDAGYMIDYDPRALDWIMRR